MSLLLRMRACTHARYDFIQISCARQSRRSHPNFSSTIISSARWSSRSSLSFSFSARDAKAHPQRDSSVHTLERRGYTGTRASRAHAPSREWMKETRSSPCKGREKATIVTFARELKSAEFAEFADSSLNARARRVFSPRKNAPPLSLLADEPRIWQTLLFCTGNRRQSVRVLGIRKERRTIAIIIVPVMPCSR